MKIELVLLGLIAVVLIVDFILRGINKKDTTEKGIEKFEGAFEESIKQSKLHYILVRKRNILTFILLVMLVKPLIHYVFVKEKGEVSENVINLGKAYNNLYFKSFNGKLYKGYNINTSKNKILRRTDALQIEYRIANSDEASKAKYESILNKINDREKDYHRDGIFSKNGDELFLNDKEEYYYYLRAKPTLNSYYTKYYKSKPYFFAISLGGLLILVFLFNDKIKAR